MWSKQKRKDGMRDLLELEEHLGMAEDWDEERLDYEITEAAERGDDKAITFLETYAKSNRQIGKVLRDARAKSGLSLEEAAKRAGLSTRYLAFIECRGPDGSILD